MNKTNSPTVTGAQIREARESLGLSQVEAARKARLSHPSHLSNIERGLTPSAPVLARICKALEIEPANAAA